MSNLAILGESDLGSNARDVSSNSQRLPFGHYNGPKNYEWADTEKALTERAFRRMADICIEALGTDIFSRLKFYRALTYSYPRAVIRKDSRLLDQKSVDNKMAGLNEDVLNFVAQARDGMLDLNPGLRLSFNVGNQLNGAVFRGSDFINPAFVTLGSTSRLPIYDTKTINGENVLVVRNQKSGNALLEVKPSKSEKVVKVFDAGRIAELDGKLLISKGGLKMLFDNIKKKHSDLIQATLEI